VNERSSKSGQPSRTRSHPRKSWRVESLALVCCWLGESCLWRNNGIDALSKDFSRSSLKSYLVVSGERIVSRAEVTRCDQSFFSCFAYSMTMCTSLDVWSCLSTSFPFIFRV
jgi:hypothetical protein